MNIKLFHYLPIVKKQRDEYSKKNKMRRKGRNRGGRGNRNMST